MRFLSFILTIACVFLNLLGFGQQDLWQPIVQDGFGIPNQKTVPEMEVYEDTLYVATAPLTLPGTAKLWRSGTGDAPWEDVTPPQMLDNSIHSFGKTDLGGGFFWFGTGNVNKGARIYQSRNGHDWIPISRYGFGSSDLNGAAPNMVVFQGTGDTIPYLYAGAGSHGAGFPGEVWRIPYNSSDSMAWEKIIDFDTVQTSISDTVDLISYFEVWQNKIYFGTNAKGQLWESTDGINFTQNMGVGYGFAPTYLTNIVISAIEIFRDTMYLTTTNFSGGQLWRTGDGVNFTNITDNAFGEGPAVSELRKPIVFNNQLWLTGYTETHLSTGTPIWKSDNGFIWSQSNTNGFGDTLNNGQNAVVVGFQNYVYFGGPNYSVGGQVWRTDVITSLRDDFEKNCQFSMIPNPMSNQSKIHLGDQCPDIERISIYDVQGKLIKSLQPNNKSIIIERGDLDEGIYFYQLKSLQGEMLSGKFVVR